MTKTDALDQLVEAITVDCYDAYEQMSAFHTVFAEEVPLPTEVAILGMPVQVLDFDIRENGTELTVHCRGGAALQEFALADLTDAPADPGPANAASP